MRAGDRDSLEQAYTVEYRALEEAQDASQRWQVRLVPKHAPLSEMIRELRVAGTGTHAERMELEEASGDLTVTRIIDAKSRQRWTEAEQRALRGGRTP